MQQTLKLTITAVGENDSVFLTPCDPVTLHESCLEDPSADDEAEQDDGRLSAPDRAARLPSTDSSDDDVMVMFDD